MRDTRGGKTLNGLPAHPISGTNIVYAVHPYFAGPGWDTPADWQANWGFLTGQVPVVADEWSEYETSKASCQPDAPTLVPEFLSYLAAHGVGLVAWGLDPGLLVTTAGPASPTAFTPGTPFVCQDGAGLRNGQGSGADVMAYFAAHSHPVP